MAFSSSSTANDSQIASKANLPVVGWFDSVLCEHKIQVTPRNCLNVLVIADLVHATYLREVSNQLRSSLVAMLMSSYTSLSQLLDLGRLIDHCATFKRDLEHERI